MKHSVTRMVLAALAVGVSSVTAVQAQVSCGAVITGSAVMTSNLNCIFNSPAFVIDGGEVDMAGHRVACLPGQDGIQMINGGGRLRNGSIEGCDRGVVVGGVGRHTVINVTATNGDDIGFQIFGAGNKLINNSASGFANDGFKAFTFLPPMSDTFTGNVAANNGGHGFNIIGGHTSMVGNIAVGNALTGIYIDGEGNKITRNTTFDNGTSGIYVDGSRNKVMLNTNIGNQTVGLAVYSDDTKVKQNVSISNASDGVQTNGAGNSYGRNTSVLNGSDGFDLTGNGAQVSSSVAILNGAKGLWTHTANTDIQLKANRVMSNVGIGIDVDSGTTTIKGNLAYDNFPDDADDANSLCSTNIWISNVFGDAADACIE